MWDPYLKQDIEKLEGVQRQATRFITGVLDYRTCERAMLLAYSRTHALLGPMFAPVVRAVIVGKSSFCQQTRLYVQGG